MYAHYFDKDAVASLPLVNTSSNITLTETYLSQNHDIEVISIAVVFSTFSLFTLICRITSIRIKGQQLKLDDWLLVPAWVAPTPTNDLTDLLSFSRFWQQESPR